MLKKADVSICALKSRGMSLVCTWGLSGDTVVAAATPADGTFLLPFLLVTMMDVNSMVEMGGNEVSLHGRCEFDGGGDGVSGVVEGGLKLDAYRW